MKEFQELLQSYNEKWKNWNLPSEPASLYEPINYILDLGGKRFRPTILLAGYNLYSKEIDYAFEAAHAFEMFHNFSLVHDDIMDDAFTRRGFDTVHIKYDSNAAILSGDVMLIYAYRLFEKYEDAYLKLTKLFTKTAIEVCEGQRMDMDFETQSEVQISDYLKMIELKTSVLIAAALQAGAMIAGAPAQDQFHLYEFGKNLGIAFQVQDDILDTYGEQAAVGKRIGGDIIQKKKTYLYLKALELLSKEEVKQIRALYLETSNLAEEAFIQKVKSLMTAAHVKVHAEELKLVYKQLALSHLDAVAIPASNKEILAQFADKLLTRAS